MKINHIYQRIGVVTILSLLLGACSGTSNFSRTTRLIPGSVIEEIDLISIPSVDIGEFTDQGSFQIKFLTTSDVTAVELTVLKEHLEIGTKTSTEVTMTYDDINSEWTAVTISIEIGYKYTFSAIATMADGTSITSTSVTETPMDPSSSIDVELTLYIPVDTVQGTVSSSVLEDHTAEINTTVSLSAVIDGQATASLAAINFKKINTLSKSEFHATSGAITLKDANNLNLCASATAVATCTYPNGSAVTLIDAIYYPSELSTGDRCHVKFSAPVEDLTCIVDVSASTASGGSVAVEITATQTIDYKPYIIVAADEALITPSTAGNFSYVATFDDNAIAAFDFVNETDVNLGLVGSTATISFTDEECHDSANTNIPVNFGDVVSLIDSDLSFITHIATTPDNSSVSGCSYIVNVTNENVISQKKISLEIVNGTLEITTPLIN